MNNPFFIAIVLAFITSSLRNEVRAQPDIPEEFYVIESLKTDFDSDGRSDWAAILREGPDTYCRNHFSFVIYLTTSNRQQEISFGEYVGHPFKLAVRHNVIEFGYVEQGTGVFWRKFKIRYNATEHRIQVIGFDSGYTSGYRGHCTKSYNLLTGDYTVINDLFANASMGEPKDRTENHRGNKKIKAIFIEDIDDEQIERLESTGRDFESLQ